MLEKKPEWYVIQVISWTEENVKSSLFQRRESLWMENYILDVFVPTHEIISTKSSWEQVTKKKNILPWYILVQMVVNNESWYIVRNTPNVTWFLWAWNIPVPVSWAELEKLKWKIEEHAKTYSTDFQKWEEAIIKSWVFEWNTGIITWINKKKWIVKMNISLLWRDTPVEINFSEVQLKNKN